MRWSVLAFLFPLSFCFLTNAWANPDGEGVLFSIATAPPTPLQVKRLEEKAKTLPGAPMKGRLKLPSSSKPIPAIVLVQPCYPEKIFADWVALMNDWGYATLSFSRCGQPAPVFQGPIAAYDWKEGAQAAFGALKYLENRDEIDSDRIAIMSWSRFGMVPLSVLNEAGFAQFHENRFKTAVALYPFCSFARGPHDGPILVLTAASDDWVSSDICQRMGRETAKDRYPVKVVVFDGVYHGFDLPAFGQPTFRESQINPDGFNASGGTLGYDEPSHKRAVMLIKEHLAANL